MCEDRVRPDLLVERTELVRCERAESRVHIHNLTPQSTLTTSFRKHQQIHNTITSTERCHAYIAALINVWFCARKGHMKSTVQYSEAENQSNSGYTIMTMWCWTIQFHFQDNIKWYTRELKKYYNGSICVCSVYLNNSQHQTQPNIEHIKARYGNKVQWMQA